MRIQVCIAQIHYEAHNADRHIEKIKHIIAQHRDADLIVFPELILHGHPSLEKPEGLLYRKLKVHYDSISGDMYSFIRGINARVILGEIRKRREKFYNVATYIDRDTTQSYVKTHVHWTEHFVPGNALKVFDTPFGPVGINICFDAAFPEVWRVLALRGAPLIVNISAVPAFFPVRYMWNRMSGAALNNQVFVLYANRPGSYFAGGSAVFDPRGDRLAAAGTGEEILRTEIDLGEVGRWREEEAIYPHRRPLLYRDISRHAPQRTQDIFLEPVREAESA